MLIGIDGNEANVTKKVGISEYVFELLTKFSEDKEQKTENRFRIYLKHEPGKDFPSESGYWQYKVFGPKKLWTQLALPAHLFMERKKPDVFFFTSPLCTTLLPSPDSRLNHGSGFFPFPPAFYS